MEATAGLGTREAAVLIVDDHPLTRAGLRLLLEDQPGLSVCGEAGTLAEAMRLASERLPDLILLDLNLPDGSGLALLEESGGWPDPPKVLLCSGCDEDSPQVLEALRLGAVGIVPKTTAGDGVLKAVRWALGGRVDLPESLVAKLIRRRN